MSEIKNLEKVWKRTERIVTVDMILAIILIFVLSINYPVIQFIATMMIIFIAIFIKNLLIKPFYKTRMEALVRSYIVAKNSKNPCASYVYFPPYKDMEPVGKYVKDKAGKIYFEKLD